MKIAARKDDNNSNKRSDNISFAPKAVKLPKLLFLACWPLVPEQQVAGGGKKGKNNLGVIASPLPHSIFSICTPVKGRPRPLLNHIFFVMLQTWIFWCFRYEGWTATFATVSFFSRSSILQLHSQWTWWKVWIMKKLVVVGAIWSADILLRLSKQSSNALKRIKKSI